MTTNGLTERHWLHVGYHFLIDMFMVWAAFFLGTLFRFGSEWDESWVTYIPGVVVASVIFPSSLYIAGLYSSIHNGLSLRKRLFLLAICILIAAGVIVLAFYLRFSLGIGRGVMGLSLLAMGALTLLHHVVLHFQLRLRRDNVAFVIASEDDEDEAELLERFGCDDLNFCGYIPQGSYQPSDRSKVLCHFEELPVAINSLNLDRIACSIVTMANPAATSILCRLRYSGISVVTLVSMFEEIHQFVPLELVDSNWLLSASGSPRFFYIRKVKRLFDVSVSLSALVCLSPFLLVGMLLVKVTSKGAVFYRQERVGRFGRHFTITKLRTMRADAEADGARWASVDDDRVTPVGGFLRKYRIDEIPQLFNVLKGEMSFVGPRPEREEFIELITAEVTLFRERLLLQPGLTGWAQVRYPYGANIEDSRRKLEHDLYYAKYMGIFLDLFILLDTVKIVLGGGVRKSTSPKADPLDLALTKYRRAMEARCGPEI